MLSPIGGIFGLIGLVLGIVGIRATRKPARTGKVVAITGLVLSVVALLLVTAAAVGVRTVLNDPSAVDGPPAAGRATTRSGPEPAVGPGHVIARRR